MRFMDPAEKWEVKTRRDKDLVAPTNHDAREESVQIFRKGACMLLFFFENWSALIDGRAYTGPK
jgi:hypothetical protein